jgi:hypothetical protein
VATAHIAGDAWLRPGDEPADLGILTGGARPDIFIVNLECALQVGPARPDRRALLPLDAGRLRELMLGGTTVCIMANNHITDSGEEGLIATLEVAKRAGMLTVGAGANLAEARAPLVLEIERRKIALLAYADTAPHVGAIAATDRTPGVAPLDSAMVISDVRQVASKVQDVWLFLHWGLEFVRFPEPRQRELAQAFARAGATLIVGAHTHVVSGVETVGGAAVCYSLGNFIFPPIPLKGGGSLRWGRTSRCSFLLKGALERSAWHWKPVHFLISEAGNPQPLSPVQEQLADERLGNLSHCFTDTYLRRYPSLRRRDAVAHAAWRLWSMSWADRTRVLKRQLNRLGFQRTRDARSATGGGQ